MKLKQINKGYKCPNCNKYGLEWFHKLCYSPMMGISEDTILPSEAKGKAPAYTGSKVSASIQFLRCRFCLAEFVEDNSKKPIKGVYKPSTVEMVDVGESYTILVLDDDAMKRLGFHYGDMMEVAFCSKTEFEKEYANKKIYSRKIF